MKMKQTIVMAVMLMALVACKNSQTQVAEIIDLPRAETPDSVAQAMETFFQKAATDSLFCQQDLYCNCRRTCHR